LCCDDIFLGDSSEENGTKRKWRLQFVCCKLKTEMANFRVFAENRNGRQKFVFLGWQKINGNWQLLFEQTCISMLVSNDKGRTILVIIYSVVTQEHFVKHCYDQSQNCQISNEPCWIAHVNSSYMYRKNEK
jgi:hypothetical protein